MILQQQGCKKITEFGRINFDLENQPLSRHMYGYGHEMNIHVYNGI